MDSYLADEMSSSQRREFEEKLRLDPELAKIVEIQKATDDWLVENLTPLPSDPKQIEALLDDAGESLTLPISTNGSRSRRVAMLAIAAAIGWLLFAFVFSQPGERPKPFFQPRALAEIYHESVSNGFRPYYNCEDDQRFAATFKQRLGVDLRLGDMPQGSKMLGLSYPGGLSRDTTAILFRVDEKPVMVFVDRVGTEIPAVTIAESSGLHVAHSEVDGLVLFEVTPHPSKRVSVYLSK